MAGTVSDNKTNTDNGFTLVELIICVAILALASLALMKSFSMATMVNAKAQRMQNATSLAESVMEEVKSSTITQLKTKYGSAAISISDADFAGYSGPQKDAAAAAAAGGGATAALLEGGDDAAGTRYYVLWKKDTYAAQSGEKFDVTATMRISPYIRTEESDDASDANSIKLPVIEEIDTHTKTVLTAKELNKYDVIAKDYFHDHTVTPGEKPLESKKIIVTKKGDGSNTSSSEITVTCTVVYTDSGVSTYSKEVFKGTYVPQKNKDGEMAEVDNGIYIFYSRAHEMYPSEIPAIDEEITIDDSSSNDDHKVYIIFQNSDDLDGTTLKITDGSDTKIGPATSNSDIKYTDPETGEVKKGIVRTTDGYQLITNLPSSLGGTDGSILEKKKKNRVFEVTVDVSKSGDSTQYASISSTVDVRE